jgi:hypothetical protein
VSSRVIRTLQAIDWDFALPRSGYVPPPHWYPGTFVPALSDALIEALTPSGGTVFDPYGGIGTTGWSAIRTGRSCHVADANPIAILVAYITTSLLAMRRSDSSQTLIALGQLGQAIGRNDDLFGPMTAGGTTALDEAVAGVSSPSPNEILAQIVAGPPQWDLLRIWIADSTISELSALMDNISQSQSVFVQLIGLSMASATARSVSSQHASWGHIADNVRPREMTEHSVYAASTRWLKRTRAFVEVPMVPSHPGLKAPKPSVHLRNWSMPNGKGRGDADLLVTSPPYADAIDYTLSQRLSLYLLGYDDNAIKGLVSNEIGARRKRAKTTSRTTWSDQLCSALIEQVTWLKPKSSVCLVLPHRDSGRSAGEEDMKSTLEKAGWSLFFEKDRSIHQSHTRQSWTSIKKETILAFNRE